MDPHAPPLKALSPQPIDSPSPNRAFPVSTAPSSSIPALPLRPAMDQQLPDRSMHMDDMPRTTSIPRGADFPQAGDFPPKAQRLLQGQRLSQGHRLPPEAV
ncbi:uncharacterized protein TrAtP1_000264 [Trichoderma atroviride]|uniref:uncharacterized protein n=1 Tax=Hypocrea atroviridis TaxID=63577 RepID=UPI0033200B20|nr:hypothetical protein TrAtP1_000264 [Trichoderma atroviride]